MSKSDLQQVWAAVGGLALSAFLLLAGYARRWMREKLDAMNRVGPSPGLPVPKGHDPDDKYGQRVEGGDTVPLSVHEAALRRRDTRIRVLEGALDAKNADGLLKDQRIAELEESLASALSGFSEPVQELTEEPKTPLVLSVTPFEVVEVDDRTTARPPK